MLWAMEYFNERIFIFLASYAESGILGTLNTHKFYVGIELSSSFLKHPVKMLCVVTPYGECDNHRIALVKELDKLSF
jgi:hypothetical protein